LAPGAFIQHGGKNTGLIVRLDSWVLREACRQLGQWLRRGHQEMSCVAVNVSALRFSTQFCSRIKAHWAANSLPLELLELSTITEPGHD